jgi:AhpD family alkylhydroperoxidase
MNRDKIYKEMKEMFGLVPSFFKLVPDSTLEHEWELFKAIQLNETAIPNKYKELIGVAVSAASRCKYCSFFHTEMAKLNGATDAEIEEAVHYAKSSAGWSTYINGLQIDYDEFKDEVRQVCDYVREKQFGSRECVSYGDWTCKEEEAPTAI